MPGDARALHNAAIAAFRGGRLEEARQRLVLAVAQAPALAEAHSDLGIVLQLMGRPLEALACFERALALRPSLLGALVNRAIVELAIGRHEAALASCERALEVAPDNLDVLNTRGVALYGLARPEEAIACFDRALAVDPRSAKTWQNRGIALAFLRRQEDAARDLERALALDPTLEFAPGALMRARLQTCDWTDFARLRAWIAGAVRAGRRACDAFTFLALTDSAADALSCARIWAARYPPLVAPLWRGERYGHERIRVAYLSSDFHEHATAYLMAELFERHDRARFEVSAVSWDVEAPSAMRTRLRAAFEHFVD
ncbi:MAG TPA: tetratricopeptide repeat protein, partial [Candidatus Acidoferrales bacterium]|nr:tetratricopeptide repeat protein [Candidatus Acidoferrales bacterium]